MTRFGGSPVGYDARSIRGIESLGALMMDPLISGVLAGVTSGSVMAAVLGFVLSRRTEVVKREVEIQFERLNDTFRSQRAWKEKSVAELLGPVCIQLERTKRAYARWSNKNLFLEA